MDAKFDFIGFDACLMGTLETANILASYADYMYASEEMEPGDGWDYRAIAAYLDENPQNAAGSSSNLANIVRGVYNADNYGGNNKSEGYTNMVDLRGIVDACERYAASRKSPITTKTGPTASC